MDDISENNDSLVGAGISPKERLERIENILGLINSKLDSKANTEEVHALEMRVREIEIRGTHSMVAAQEEARRVANERLEDIEEVRVALVKLERDHNKLQERVSWAFGGVAAAVIFSDLFIRYFA